MTPALDDVLDRLHVVSLPMRVRFRGITTRELALIDGPAGWGEFGAFLEYGDAEAAHWLAAALDSAYGRRRRRCGPDRRQRHRAGRRTAAQVPEMLARFPGARTAKVKVAEPGQTLDDDVARVDAVRAAGADRAGRRQRRLDRRRGHRGRRRADRVGPLEYIEQPCATVDELAAVRRRIDVPVAADESIRKADDPLAVVRAGAADIAVLKVAPLGGISALLEIAAQIDIPVVVSSALDSAVGIAVGLAAAAALPNLDHACGLGTGGLFVEDVTDPVAPVDGYLPVGPVTPDPARLQALAAAPDRRQWWIDRVKACYPLLS